MSTESCASPVPVGEVATLRLACQKQRDGSLASLFITEAEEEGNLMLNVEL